MKIGAPNLKQSTSDWREIQVLLILFEQVACKCAGIPSGMECIEMWDGNSTPHLTEGRRYVWECPNCKHQVCVSRGSKLRYFLLSYQKHTVSCHRLRVN